MTLIFGFVYAYFPFFNKDAACSENPASDLKENEDKKHQVNDGGDKDTNRAISSTVRNTFFYMDSCRNKSGVGACMGVPPTPS